MSNQRRVRAVIIPAEVDKPASIEDILPDAATLQRLVGGWIEAINGDDWTAFVNEEGKLDMLPINQAGNRILGVLEWDAIGLDVVVGPLVILGPADSNGDETGITDAVLAKILDWYRANGTVTTHQESK